MKTSPSNSNAAHEILVPEAGDEFRKDVLIGLSLKEKRLDSKYFYDDNGSRIFQRIMKLPEYYLTACEEEIFIQKKKLMKEIFLQRVNLLQIVELGAGDGEKTKVVLKYLKDEQVDFSYTAIDISLQALRTLGNTLTSEIAGAKVQLINEDYLRGLSKVERRPGEKLVLLFLGSNIGNFSRQQAQEFLNGIRSYLLPDDLLMIGFDLRKSPEIILRAYNDPEGVTKAFNLNLLQRINHELGGDFDLNNFEHIPVYDTEKGEARSYLRSKKAQNVFISKLSRSFSFEEGELVHTEISRKYDLKEIRDMATSSRFINTTNLYDGKEYFCDAIYKAQ